MKANVFFKSLSSSKLNETFAKHFGGKVKLDHYTREQLEDMRNKLRTKLFQQEGSAGYNDLLTNETYQKDKAMLQLLNTRIKEMLGEDIKKLKDTLDQINEGKKGVKAAKHPQGSKGTSDKDYDGDGKIESPKDEVWGSRAKAAAKAGKPFKEQTATEGKRGPDTYGKDDASDKPLTGEVPDNPWHDSRAAKFLAKQVTGSSKNRVVKGKAQSAPQPKDDMDESAEKCNHTPKGKKCPVHGLKECGMYEESKPSAGMTKKEKSAVVKKAKAGGDIGKPGKGFKEVEKAAKKGGAKDPKAVAAAAMWKQQAKESFRKNVKTVNESLERFLAEDEEGKAKAITSAGDMVNDFTSWMQRVGQYQTKALIELADAIRADFGLQQAEAFKQAVSPALAATLETLTQQRETISNAVAALAGEEVAPEEQMGAEPADIGPPEAAMKPSEPDQMNTGDEFAASDAAAGGEETSGREMRESRFSKKLAESHNIISKLAR